MTLEEQTNLLLGPFDFAANRHTATLEPQNPNFVIVLPLDVAYLKSISRQMVGEQGVVQQPAEMVFGQEYLQHILAGP
jgi:hypothetical protein